MMALAAFVAQAADPPLAAAVAARTAGRTAEAVAALEALSKIRGDDADIWLNLGLAYTDARRYPEAEQALLTALGLAPDYAEARMAYTRIAYYRGDTAEARARLAPLLARTPVAPEAQALSRQLTLQAQANPAVRIDAAYTRSTLSNGLPDWTSILFSGGKRLSADLSVVGSVEHTERFDLQDTYVEALAYRRLGDADAYLGLGGAPNADYRAKLALRGGVERLFATSGLWRLNFGADGGWYRYGVGDVRTLQPYARVTYDRLALTLRSVNTLDERDEYQGGYSLRAELAASERLRLTAGYARAPESTDGRTVKVRVSSVGAALDVTPRTTISIAAARDERDAYSRNDFTIGLTRRF